MPRIARWPFRALEKVMRPLALRASAREHRAQFQTGEKSIAVDLTNEGNLWLASDRALYIEPTPSRRNRRVGRFPGIGLRIPYERILSIHETSRGREATCTVQLMPLLGGRTITETGAGMTPVTQVIQSHIDELIRGRRKVTYFEHDVRFVCRVSEPDGRLRWYLEDSGSVEDPASEQFNNWVEITLSALADPTE
jgi:hypothetical protein